jgi:hypothetical protein
MKEFQVLNLMGGASLICQIRQMSTEEKAFPGGSRGAALDTPPSTDPEHGQVAGGEDATTGSGDGARSLTPEGQSSAWEQGSQASTSHWDANGTPFRRPRWEPPAFWSLHQQRSYWKGTTYFSVERPVPLFLAQKMHILMHHPQVLDYIRSLTGAADISVSSEGDVG